jgi:hypothetical protein
MLRLQQLELEFGKKKIPPTNSQSFVKKTFELHPHFSMPNGPVSKKQNKTPLR